MDIKLTIITPVFNGEKFIGSCIQNVIDQCCHNLEHVILDACSTDGTCSIISGYAEKYHHIRWISEKDSGQSDAMNKGIAIAKGKIISFLNVDDFYAPDVLNLVTEMFERFQEPTLLVGNCNVWDDFGNLLFVNKPSKLKLKQLLVGPPAIAWPINPSAYFYHKSLHERIGLYNVEEHYALDLDFILRAVQVANLQYINQILGNYRFLEGTKTFIDLKNTNTAERNQRLLSQYKNGLSPLLRSMFPAYKTLQRILHWVEYFKDPFLAVTVLRDKIARKFK